MNEHHALEVLADPTRRAIYELAVASGDPVSRDQVAEAMGIARQTAAYHLDRLAEAGLLDVDYVRLSGRTGPGAGRPAKVYAPADAEFQMTVPPRRYLLAARILLDAVRAGADRASLLEAARRVGRGLGAEGLDDALVTAGYRPVEEGGEIRFSNCPFHLLAEEDRDTTCALNLALVEGMVEGAGDGRRPRLQPEPGSCCVRVGSGRT